MSQKEFITPQEYCERTGATLDTVWRHLRSGELPSLPRGKGQRRWYLPITVLTAQTTPNEPTTAVSNVASMSDFRERKAASL